MSHRIKRFYYYAWIGDENWDSGLIDYTSGAIRTDMYNVFKSQLPIWPSTSRAAAATLAAVLSAFAYTSAAGADTVLATEALPTAVTAFRGHVVWSSYDRRSRVYSLNELFHGHLRRLPVPARNVPFDVDLGPDPEHGVSAVYSRCRSESGNNLGSDGVFAYYSDGSHCNLYLYPLKGRRERRLRVRGERRASEFLPTIWGRRIAFARVFEGRHGRSAEFPFLYRSGLGAHSKSHRLPDGTRGPYPNTSFSGPPSYDGGPGPIALDLRGTRLAFAWEAQLERCRPGDQNEFPLLLSEMWVLRIGSPAKRIEHGCAGDPTHWLTTPSLGAQRLFYYQQRNIDDTAIASRLHAYDLRSGRILDHQLPPEVVATARDGSATYYVRFASGSGYRVLIERASAFTLTPAD